MLEQYHVGKDWDKFVKYLKNESRGLTTGYGEIDRAIIGLPGYVTVMGEPKCFKSTFVMRTMMEKALAGHPVILIDRENGRQRIRKRMICYLAELSDGVVKSQNFRGDEEEKYKEAERVFTKLPIYIIEDHQELEDLESIIKEAGHLYKKHVLLVVDSLQSLVTDFKDRRASVDYWVFAFNDLKKKYEGWLTLVCISEKNRQVYGMGSRAGGKESGGIEYKSEMVFDLYPNKEGNAVIVECVYNRDGDTGVLTSLRVSHPYTYRLEESDSVPE